MCVCVWLPPLWTKLEEEKKRGKFFFMLEQWTRLGTGKEEGREGRSRYYSANGDGTADIPVAATAKDYQDDNEEEEEGTLDDGDGRLVRREEFGEGEGATYCPGTRFFARGLRIWGRYVVAAAVRVI